MIYYDNPPIIIRNMQPEDAVVFTEEEKAQGWQADIWKYETRLKDQEEGKCIALTAEYKGHPAGYINVYPYRQHGPFKETNYPEIVDFGVLEKFQRQGIGTVLMDVAEEIAGTLADTVFLGVGLHSGYGSAQRMYVKRGYVPDGSGIWYQGAPLDPYTPCENDDDLILYLSKKLKICPETMNEGLETESVRIRVMKKSDYDKVYELWMSCRNMGFNNLDDSRKGIEKYLDRNPSTCFIAEQNGKIAGVILAGHDGRRGFIHHLAVAEGMRRKGIAARLLENALAALKEEGIHKTACLVFNRNEAGNAFWESQGFSKRDDVAYRNKELTPLIRIDT